MAQYMESKGLVWNSDKGKYVKKLNEDRSSVAVIKEQEVEQPKNIVTIPSKCTNEEEYKLFSEYLPILKLITENKDRLLDLLMPNSSGNIPKYAVPGVPKTKSIYVSDLLARLVTEFSESKNISQREIVEAALIEYLRRYGYQLEVEKLLAKS